MAMRRKSREMINHLGGRLLDRLLVEGKAKVMPEQACVVFRMNCMCLTITKAELDEAFLDYCEGHLDITKQAGYRAMCYLKQLDRL